MKKTNKKKMAGGIKIYTDLEKRKKRKMKLPRWVQGEWLSHNLMMKLKKNTLRKMMMMLMMIMKKKEMKKKDSFRRIKELLKVRWITQMGKQKKNSVVRRRMMMMIVM